ncbi:ATP-binding cassette domain-containing protein [Kribbella turkmenica]|uniref:ATP-binding cassette domain-containing protein n=1 Tax=Kribbella turkmenica TaxID=2530375 RepID=UPI001F1AF180|nr:ABC transporter ATP-binding protein [Kribbella turkmenica]
MLAAFRTARESLSDAAGITPGWLLLYCVLVLVQAGLPGAQVVLIEDLIEGGSGAWGSLLGLTVVVGAMYPFAQVTTTVAQRMMLRLRLHYRVELAHAAARLSPSRLAMPDVVTELEASQSATHPMSDIASRPVQVLGAAATSAVLCAAIWSFNPLSGLLVLAALVPTVLAFTLISRIESKGWPQVAEHDRKAAYATEQLIQQRSGTELAILGSGPKVAGLIADRRAEATWVLDRMIRTAMTLEVAAAVLTAVLFGGALVALVLEDAGGAAAAAAIAGTISGLNAIRQCGYAFGTIVTAAPQATMYRRFVRSVPPAPPQSIVRTVQSVALDNVSFQYPGAAAPALRDVRIEARRGEMIALVGVNGAGKSTAINLLVGSLAPDRGRVLIDGTDAGGLTETERLGHFGLLVQEFGRFEFALRDAVALGSPTDVPDEHLRTALAAAFAKDLPLDTQLGQQWGGTGISGGQWQRVALARIHLRNAGVWILDEPTSAIDAEAERAVFAELRRTRHTRITIVVSHRASTLVGMDGIYVMDDGAVVQRGTYQDLISQPDGRFARLFATQGEHPLNSAPH